MTRERSDAELAAALETWMVVVAPEAVPARVLEEAFGQTVATRQARMYPWDWLTRRGRRRLDLVPLGLVGLAAVLIVSAGVGLIGGGASVGPRPSATPAAMASASRSGSVPPSAVAVVPISSEASVTVDQAIAMASDGLVVWVLTATGSLVRIDPATNSAAAGIQLAATTDLYQGISVDGDVVWVTDWTRRTLYRVSATTGTVVATIPVGMAPKGVLATGSAVWVADTHAGAVLRVDPATNTVVSTIPVGPAGDSGPNWLASGLGSIWVGIPNTSTVVRIDPITDAVQATVTIPAQATPCGGFAVTATAVWIPSCDEGRTMARIDPSTDAVVATVDLGGNARTPVVIDGAPWLSVDTGLGVPAFVARVASASNAFDLELSPGATFGGGGDMVVAGGSVWVIDVGSGHVLRLPLTAFPAR